MTVDQSITTAASAQKDISIESWGTESVIRITGRTNKVSIHQENHAKKLENNWIQVVIRESV